MGYVIVVLVGLALILYQRPGWIMNHWRHWIFSGWR